MWADVKRYFKARRRQRAIDAHLAANGGRFVFEGQALSLPDDLALSLRDLIARGAYEAPEVALIDRYLPRDLPVLELGGCLGIVSGAIGRRLAPGTRHVVVEANPALMAHCHANAASGHRGRLDVVNKAIAYGTPTVRFGVSRNVNGSRVAFGDACDMIEVPACTLAGLVATVGDNTEYALVCDIEGLEYDIFERDGAALRRCAVAIVEIHPRIFAEQRRSTDAFHAAAQAAGLRQVDHCEGVLAFRRHG